MYLILPIESIKIGDKFRYRKTWYYLYPDLYSDAQNMVGWNECNYEDSLQISKLGGAMVGLENEGD